jgi:hypothetical protein
MEKRILAVLGTLLLLVGLFIMASPVRADWDEGDSAKWVQLPDLTSNGVDVMSSYHFTLADDFQCKSTGYITSIHIWGSYLNDNVSQPTFQLGIWDDVPASESNKYSHPGEPLWKMDFNPDEYNMRKYSELSPNVPPEFFMNPTHPDPLVPGDRQVWQFNFAIAPDDAYKQTEGTIYWLSVSVYDPISFGWKSARLDQRWNDDAVWALTMSGVVTSPWSPLEYFADHPDQNYKG